jgi:hypothetical protein
LLINIVDKQLTDWLMEVAGKVPVVLNPPSEITAKPLISLYLTEVRYAANRAESARLPVQLTLCYLISTLSESELDAHEMLIKIIVAAMDVAEYETQLDPLPHSVWSAFGIAPRPYAYASKVRLANPGT